VGKKVKQIRRIFLGIIVFIFGILSLVFAVPDCNAHSYDSCSYGANLGCASLIIVSIALLFIGVFIVYINSTETQTEEEEEDHE